MPLLVEIFAVLMDASEQLLLDFYFFIGRPGGSYDYARYIKAFLSNLTYGGFMTLMVFVVFGICCLES